MDASGPIWILWMPWIHMDPFGPIWIYMDSYGSTWCNGPTPNCCETVPPPIGAKRSLPQLLRNGPSLLFPLGVFGYYTDYIQARRAENPDLSAHALHGQFLQESRMNCSRRTFESWLAALPLPAREAPIGAEVEVAAAAGYISDEAFYAQDDVVWGIYQTHPHLGAEAMAELLLPHVGSVTVATVQSWLRNARTTELGLDRLRLYRQ